MFHKHYFQQFSQRLPEALKIRKPSITEARFQSDKTPLKRYDKWQTTQHVTLYIVCIRVSTSLFFAKLPPPLNLETVRVPSFLGNSALYIGFSKTLPLLKIGFFSKPPLLKLLWKSCSPHPSRKKSLPSFPITPSQNWDPVKPSPFSKFGRRLNPYQQKGGGVGAHYDCSNVSFRSHTGRAVLDHSETSSWHCNWYVDETDLIGT